MQRVQHNNAKTSSPLQYILQAAMGQCSTLPADGNKDNGSNEQASTSSTPNQKPQRLPYGRNNSSSTRKMSREQRDSAGYRNGRTNDERHDNGDVVMGDTFSPSSRRGRSSSREVNKMVHIANQGNSKFDQYMNEDEKLGSPNSKSGRNSHSKIHCAPSPEEVLPPPPSGAVRTRCYRLNLDAPVILSPTHDHLGPMPYEPPIHLLPQHRSSRQISQSLSYESVERSPTEVAINTSMIFRGITVDKNGKMLSQNARATRPRGGARGNKTKQQQAASSRQQEKIAKAKDLVDDAMCASGEKENDAKKSNMVSLVVIGEYDEMKQLVRDGAKKLRDAEGLPDEALLAVNRPRQNNQNGPRRYYSQPSLGSSSSRKRFSSPADVHQTHVDSPASRSRSRNHVQQGMSSTTPKLRSNPRDRTSSRRFSSSGNNERRYSGGGEDRCNNKSIFGGRGEGSDWSDALGQGFDKIWICGAKSNRSPNSKNASNGSSHDRRPSKVRYEGRNESNGRFSRGGGAIAERDAPVSKDVVLI